MRNGRTRTAGSSRVPFARTAPPRTPRSPFLRTASTSGSNGSSCPQPPKAKRSPTPAAAAAGGEAVFFQEAMIERSASLASLPSSGGGGGSSSKAARSYQCRFLIASLCVLLYAVIFCVNGPWRHVPYVHNDFGRYATRPIAALTSHIATALQLSSASRDDARTREMTAARHKFEIEYSR